MTNTIDFLGFPEEGLQFLEDLKQNNDRDWFQAHKDLYTHTVLRPAQDFVLAFGDALVGISQGIEYGNQANGSGSLFRIYRDLRFTKDKTPYNTSIRMFFWEGLRKKMDNPGFYLIIEPVGGTLYAGMYQFRQPFLDAYRQAVIDDQLGPDLEIAIARIAAAGGYEIGGERYKRVPRGYDSAHERVDLLLYKSLYAQAPAIPRDVVTSPAVVDVCLAHCRTMAPLHHWLVRAGKRAGG